MNHVRLINKRGIYLVFYGFLQLNVYRKYEKKYIPGLIWKSSFFFSEVETNIVLLLVWGMRQRNQRWKGKLRMGGSIWVIRVAGIRFESSLSLFQTKANRKGIRLNEGRKGGNSQNTFPSLHWNPCTLVCSLSLPSK